MVPPFEVSVKPGPAQNVPVFSFQRAVRAPHIIDAISAIPSEYIFPFG